jgi:hypothetical protein
MFIENTSGLGPFGKAVFLKIKSAPELGGVFAQVTSCRKDHEPFDTAGKNLNGERGYREAS